MCESIFQILKNDTFLLNMTYFLFFKKHEFMCESNFLNFEKWHMFVTNDVFLSKNTSWCVNQFFKFGKWRIVVKNDVFLSKNTSWCVNQIFKILKNDTFLLKMTYLCEIWRIFTEFTTIHPKIHPKTELRNSSETLATPWKKKEIWDPRSKVGFLK